MAHGGGHRHVGELLRLLARNAASIRRGSCRRVPQIQRGTSGASPKIPSSGSTYFGVATLPRSTTSHAVPIRFRSLRASRSSGSR